MCVFNVATLFRKLTWIHLHLGWVLDLWLTSVVLSRQQHSLSEWSLFSLDIQLTFTSSDFWKGPLRRMQIHCHACQSAEQKRGFLLHLPSLELPVLFFQSLLNSKWGDCCCSEEQEGIITELAVSSSKEISLQFPYQQRNRLDFLWWCFPTDILELAQQRFIPSWNGSCPEILLDLYLLGFNCRVKEMDGKESKKYPLPSNWALSNQLGSLPLQRLAGIRLHCNRVVCLATKNKHSNFKK